MLKTILTATAVLLAGSIGAAAHTVTFGWTDNGNGTITLWNEHWHGDQVFPCSEGIRCSDNGGLTISGNGTNDPAAYGLNPYTIQWAGTVNNRDRDAMIADKTLTGYTDDPDNETGVRYNDWLYTQPLTLGDGFWYFFTGTNCCIDTMSHPVLVELKGIGSVDPGTGPGPVDPSAVPLPATLPLVAVGPVFLAVLRRRRKSGKPLAA